MPTDYNRQYNFANFQYLNPTTPLPGSSADAEFNAVKIAIDSLIEDLGLIQSDDGTLQNGIVEPRHLSSDFLTGISAPTAWTTATNYAEDDTVFHEAKLYIATEAHLSGTFATDLTAELWELVADFGSAIEDAVNITFTPAGTIASTNVQTAVEEVATDAATALAALAAGTFLVRTAFGGSATERVVTDTTTIEWDWDTAGQAKARFKRPADTITTNSTLQDTDGFSLVAVNTASGAVELNLPSLDADDAGWFVDVVKVNNAETSPIYIIPDSGNVRSGGQTVARARRSVPHAVFRCYWTGTLWVIERTNDAPLGAVLDCALSALPVGYEWANGQTLASASTNYPEFYSANGSSGVVIDARGRVVAGQDDMGGTSANRLTGLSDGVNGDTFGAAGGLESTTLAEANLPAHVHTQTAQNPTFTYGTRADVAATGGTTVVSAIAATLEANTVTTTSDGTPGNTGSVGSGTATNNVQPTIVLNKIVVVE
jgi:microcystin-dependent protein